MSDKIRKLYGISVCKKPSVVLLKWRIEFYSEKNETLLPNKVRAGSSVIINRSSIRPPQQGSPPCVYDQQRRWEQVSAWRTHIPFSRDRGEKGRRDGVMGDQREDRGGLKGGHWSKSSREKVSSLPACLPAYPPPADWSLAKKIKFIAWKEGGKSM